MKRNLLRLLLLICGLNLFTSCYGMPPRDYWPESSSCSGKQGETKAALTAEPESEEEADLEETDDPEETDR